MVKNENDEAPSLSAFYRKGRKCFVPLTADEISRAGLNSIDLLRIGLVEWYQQGGVSCYRLTEEGRSVFWKQQGARA